MATMADARAAIAAARHVPSARGLDFIKGFESFVPYVYDDLRPPVKGKYVEWKPSHGIRGTLTIGYGHTDAANYKLPFRLKDAPDGFTITEAQASEILDVDLDECEDDVNTLVRVPLTQGQFDALLSFVFNCGAGNLKSLIAPLNKLDYAGCRRKFDSYVRSKGKKLRGLQRRRDGEQVLWDEGDARLVIPAEIVHHGADVDAPGTLASGKPATVADLRPYSRKLRTVAYTKLAAGFSAVTSTAAAVTDFVSQARGVSDAIDAVQSNAVLLVVALAAVAAISICAVIEGWSLDDFVSGRWFPSGVANDEPVDDHGPAEPQPA